MIPSALEYARATSIDDVIAALAADDGTQLLAGGQSLIPLLKFRMITATRVLDISGIDELTGITHDGGAARIGAATTYRDLLDSTALRDSHPLIAEATGDIGDVQVRNRGTIGGALAHADPASDMPAVMLALNASFALRSADGERRIAARDFFQGPFETAKAANELLVAIDVPALPAGAGSAYVMFEQKASGYALVGAAAVVAMADGKVTQAELAFTGLAETPFLANGTSALVGSDASDEACADAAETAVGGVAANDDLHAPADYRRHLGIVAARRSLRTAAARAT